MAVKQVKVGLVPVNKQNINAYLVDKVLNDLESARSVLDAYSKTYTHENPWQYKYFQSPKFYLYRVRIGAIGRLATCKDAALLGVLSDTPAYSAHFTCMGLFYVYRMARQVRKKYQYLYKIEEWANNYLSDKGPHNSRYLQYYNIKGNNGTQEEN